MPAWKFAFKPVALAIAALSTATLALAQALPTSEAEGSRLWFVEFAGKTVADGASLAAVQAEQAAFRAAAAAAGVAYSERRSFNSLFNGLAISVEASERAKLSRVSGVKALHPIEIIQAPTPEDAVGSAIELSRALALSRADIAQNSLNLTGAGVKVGIIDTGVDIDHPAFGGSGTNGTTTFPTARIVAGWDFVGNAYDAGGTGAALIPVPDANPDDCNGHGTHVAGIVGANGGGIKGVAPGVTFGAYRVFGCAGSTSADIMLAAMERALADGMQVVNQSIGSSRQWPQYPTAQAASRLGKKGVVMVASIGNSGPVPNSSSADGLFAAGAPGVGTDVIGVASFDNAQSSFTVSGTPYGYTPASGAPLAPTSGSFPMAKTGVPGQPTLPTTAPDACTALPVGSLAGQVALIRRGSCGFYVKATNAQNAGAAAVVLYNNAAGALNANAVGTPALMIPVVGITAAQGATLDAAIVAAIVAGPTTMTWTPNAVGFPFGTGGLISGFSSFGLAADLSFKPDIGAPGGGIFSAYPLEAGGGATLSGTSMSSPHVAGAAALILEALPNAALGREGPIVGRNAPPMINMLTRMINTAQPKAWSGNAASGLIDHTFRQGGGMVDVVAAVLAEQFVVPAKIALGETPVTPVAHKLTIRNDALVPVSYALSHVPGVAAGPNGAVANSSSIGSNYAPSAIFNAPSDVTFSSPTVVVPAKGTASVNVTVAGNAGLPNRSLYGGYVKLTPQGAGSPIQVAFAGFKGDYQSTVVLTPTASGFPWLAQIVGTSYSNRPAGATYTLVGNDIPFVLMHLDHQSRTLKLEAFDAVTAATRGVISEEHYVGRSATPTGFFANGWNGTTTMGTQPNGTYTIRLSVLKALGDTANPAHWETFNTSTVTIARP